MDTLPEARDIRAMHPVDLTSSREKLFMFLSGWLGGPQLYQQAFGHPRLRMRHFPFPIGIKERDQWLLCMCKALDDMPLEPVLREGLARAFAQLANHMINQGE
jgi:hemoglobin